MCTYNKIPYRRKVKLQSGVAEFLEKLKNQDVKMCVATVTDRFVVEEVDKNRIKKVRI